MTPALSRGPSWVGTRNSSSSEPPLGRIPIRVPGPRMGMFASPNQAAIHRFVTVKRRSALRVLRGVFQVFFLAGVVAVLVRGLLGLTTSTCETYCPFGGIAALYPLLRFRTYTCRLTELNVALFVSVVGLTLLTKKTFCSWICPLGTIEEWLGKLGKKLLGRSFRPPAGVDSGLKYFRYVVLALVLALTWSVWRGDLGFRAYDPFYILFTWGGHETLGFSVYVLIGVLALAIVVPFSWCRYLCPLGAAIDPLSRHGALRIKRNREACTDCGKCDGLCPHGIPVSSVAEITARDCTNCLDCLVGCPEKGALVLSWYGKGGRP